MQLPILKMTGLCRGLTFGVFIGLSGILVTLNPYGMALEENFGLALLFKWRGESLAPEEIVVVALDKESADDLNLSRDTRKWPRSYHAQMVKKLKKAGARVIVFDVFFKNSRKEDALLASSIRDAGNVILIQAIERENILQKSHSGQMSGGGKLERIVRPTPALAQAAASLAAFPLPKVPVRVNQFWTFKNGSDKLPTMPVVTFQVLALQNFDEMLHLFKKALNHPNVIRAKTLQTKTLQNGQGRQADSSMEIAEKLLLFKRENISEPKRFTELIRILKQILGSTNLISEVITEILKHHPEHYSERLKALIKMYTGEDSRYLNFYGPPGTITTVSYFEAFQTLDQAEKDRSASIFSGKVVFIGASEMRPDSQKKDDFNTVFSQANGLNLSGVEIAATAFANLLKDHSIRPLHLSIHLIILLLWGLAVGMLCLLLSPAKAFFWTIGAIFIFSSIAYKQFTSSGNWLPLIIPLFFQTPLAGFGALLWHFVGAKKEHAQIKKAFGYYLPSKVVDQLSDRVEDLMEGNQLVQGTVLYTDVANYTALSESMTPKDLAALMSRYYKGIFAPVEQYGGTVLNVTGDSMLAIWPSSEHHQMSRNQACQTALKISDILDQFNCDSAYPSFRTRIGVHCGQIFLGNIGGGHRLEYTVIGDMVNTASRIEGLNKYLNTRVLVSRRVLDGLDEFLTRDLGIFLMAGKTIPLEIYELMGYIDERNAEQEKLFSDFSTGLSLYRAKRWVEAIEIFSSVLKRREKDGPAQFYINQCQHLIEHPILGDWDGVVQIEKK